MWKYMAVVTAAGLLIAADKVFPAKAQDAAQREVKKLQGMWEMESYLIGDAEASEDEVRVRWLVIEGDRWTKRIGQVGYHMAWKVDPNKSPKHLDLTTTTMGKAEVRRCIYQLTGDKLVVCLPLANAGSRPSKIEQAEDVCIAVYKRRKQ